MERDQRPGSGLSLLGEMSALVAQLAWMRGQPLYDAFARRLNETLAETGNTPAGVAVH